MQKNAAHGLNRVRLPTVLPFSASLRRDPGNLGSILDPLLTCAHS